MRTRGSIILLLAVLFSFIVVEAGGQTISALSSDLSYDPKVLSNPRVVIGESGKLAEKDVVMSVV